MHRFIVVAIGLSVFLLCSCSSQKTVEDKPAPKFQGVVLAKEIDESGMIGVPQELTSEFDTEDKQVVAHLTFENMSGNH